MKENMSLHSTNADMVIMEEEKHVSIIDKTVIVSVNVPSLHVNLISYPQHNHPFTFISFISVSPAQSKGTLVYWILIGCRVHVKHE